MRSPPLALLATLLAAVWLAACGSIVRSTKEPSPLPHGSEMNGLAYWLPKGSIIIDGTWDKDSKDCVIKVATLIEADTSSRWRLTRQVNHLFEDTVAIEVDPATGLLKSVNGTSEDKTADIVATALQSAAKVVTTFSGPATKSLIKEMGPPPCEPLPLKAPFHLKIPVEEMLHHYCRTFVVTGPAPSPNPTATPPSGPTPTPSSSGPTPTSSPPVVTFTVRISRDDAATSSTGTQIGKRIDNNTIVDGVVVRAPVPYKITINKGDDKDLVAEQQLFLPDPERIYYLPLDRTPFVKNETKIVLVGGVVQSVSVTRPSIFLGIVGIPKKILEALIPLLGH